MAIAANGSKATAEKPGRRLRIPLSVKFATVMVVLVPAAARAFRRGQPVVGVITEPNAPRFAGRAAERQRRLPAASMASCRNWKASSPGLPSRHGEAPASSSSAPTSPACCSQFPAVTELFYIDGKGIEQLKVSRFAPDFIASQTNHATEPRFVETVKARTWFGPVYVRNGAELSTTVGMAHADGGVTVAEIDLAFVFGSGQRRRPG